MASFTGVGDTVTLSVPDKGEAVDIDISGTYDMTIALQREVGSPGSGAWEELNRWDTANATVAYRHITEKYGEELRLIVLVDTSGTATATLTNASAEVDQYLTVKDRLGNPRMKFNSAGVKFYDRDGNFLSPIEPAPVNVTAATTLTAEDHADRTIVFNDADGATITLPAATGTGHVYRFLVGVTVTSNNDIIQVANATDEFVGNLFQIDTDTGDAIAAYPALDGDGFDTVTLDGSTKGGIQGDFIEIVDIASGKFAIRGTVLATGTPASPFSAAVS